MAPKIPNIENDVAKNVGTIEDNAEVTKLNRTLEDVTKINETFEDDFDIDDETDAYHAKRREQIIQKYPELRQFMKISDPSFKYVLIMCILSQFVIAYMLKDSPIWLNLLMALTAGVMYACALTNGLHEIAHDHAIMENTPANKILGLLTNTALVWPLFGTFYKSHHYHHTTEDTDLDVKHVKKETVVHFDHNFATRLLFLMAHPITSGISLFNSPIVKVQMKGKSRFQFNWFVFWNLITLSVSNTFILVFMGWPSLLYLLAAFWINESLLFQGSKTFWEHWSEEHGSNTYSNFGWVNYINFNVGYHMVHHDFPEVPGRYLRDIYKTAKEFYSDPRYIEPNFFRPTWNMLTAKPYQGLMKFPSKLHAT